MKPRRSIHGFCNIELTWVLVFAACFGFGLGLKVYGSPAQRISRSLGQLVQLSREIPVERPGVLLVDPDNSDRLSVLTAAGPRGYPVVLADDVHGGLEALRRKPSRIGIIVLDASLPEAQSIMRTARAMSPDIRLVVLERRPGVGELSSLLTGTVLK